MPVFFIARLGILPRVLHNRSTGDTYASVRLPGGAESATPATLSAGKDKRGIQLMQKPTGQNRRHPLLETACRLANCSLLGWSLLLATTLVTFHFGVQSTWAIVDDWHDIPYGLERLQEIAEAPAANLLAPARQRYRPLFHVLNSGLPWLLSTSPALHHVLRVAWLFAGIAATRFLLRNLTGTAGPGLLVPLFILSDPTTVFNTLRLGPQEGLLVPLLAGKLLAVWLLTGAAVRGQERRVTRMAAASFALTFLLLGVKEVSLAACGPVLIYETWLLTSRCRSSSGALVRGFLAAQFVVYLYTLTVVGHLFFADNYVSYSVAREHMTLAVFLDVGIAFLRELFPWPVAGLLLLGAYGAFRWLQAREVAFEKKVFAGTVVAVIAAVFLFCTAFGFFMARYILPATWLVCLLAGSSVFLTYRYARYVHLKWAVAAAAGFAAVMLLVRIPGNIERSYQYFLQTHCWKMGNEALFDGMVRTGLKGYPVTPALEKARAIRAFAGPFWRSASGTPLVDASSSDGELQNRIVILPDSESGGPQPCHPPLFLVADCDGRGREWVRDSLARELGEDAMHGRSLQIEYVVTPERLFATGNRLVRMNLSLHEIFTGNPVSNEAYYFIYSCRSTAL